jgi:hypothetical protein
LHSLKYLLLAFFLRAIVLKMDPAALDYFIHSPYNMVADIKMLYFYDAKNQRISGRNAPDAGRCQTVGQ